MGLGLGGLFLFHIHVCCTYTPADSDKILFVRYIIFIYWPRVDQQYLDIIRSDVSYTVGESFLPVTKIPFKRGIDTRNIEYCY